MINKICGTKEVKKKKRRIIIKKKKKVQVKKPEESMKETDHSFDYSQIMVSDKLKIEEPELKKIKIIKKKKKKKR